jgi:hypothetical protein
MIAGVELSDGICGELVCREMVCFAGATATTVVPVTVPEVAVTVMDVPGAALPSERVAVALPEASVVPEFVTIEPALAVKVIPTPVRGLPLPSRAVAVMAEGADPSAGIDPELDTEIEVSVPFPAPVLEPLNESPPHAASNRLNADKAAIEKNLRMIHPD